MIARLDELFGPDGKTRWRMILISAAAVAIWLLLSGTSGAKTREAQDAATLFGAVVFVGQMGYYCAGAAKSTVDSRWASIPRRLLLAGAATVVLALVPGPAVEAAILDRRLLALTRGGPLSPAQAVQISVTLKIAATVPVKVPEATRLGVYRAIKSAVLGNPSSRPIIDSADAMVRYTRALSPSRDVRGATPAKEAEIRGAALSLTIFSRPAGAIPTPSQDASIREAISQFSLAIESAGPGEQQVLMTSRTLRATLYLMLRQPQAALADAQELESAGGSDLSDVLSIEGVALFMLGGREDLTRAIACLTAVAQMDPPSWAADVPGAETLLRIDTVGNIGKAYYGLGKYDLCIAETERALSLLHDAVAAGAVIQASTVREYQKLAYLSLVASELQLGRLDRAKADALAWKRLSEDDPLAARLVSELDSGNFDRQRWLDLYVSSPALQPLP